MKLILASSPEGKRAITEKVVEFVGKPVGEISVCIINEANALSENDKRWCINGMQKIAKTFGGKVGFCNLLALNTKQIEERLSGYDVIWCFGGNTDYLKYIFDKTGFSGLLPKLLKTKVWVGSSAGSCVMCKRPSIIPLEYGDKIPKYLNLCDFAIRPHIWAKYSTDDKYNYKNLITESYKQKVYALSDQSAVIVDGDKIYMHGKHAHELLNGKVVNKV